MRHADRTLLTLLLLVGVVAGCGQAVTAQPTEPAVVVEAGASGPPRVTLSARAAERLGIETTPVRLETIDGLDRSVVPYAALLYDPTGATWAFTTTAPLVFVRAPLTVDRIAGDIAILSSGPTVGTAVVTVGGSELYGAETGVGGDE
jgi:hypothetical protein